MKRIIAVISLLTWYLFSAPLAFAQGTTFCPEGQFGILCTINESNFGGVIGTIIIILFIVAIIMALIWLVIGGIKWITSSGDKTAVDAARGQIIAAVIGLVIVFLAFFILNIILTIFGVEGGITGLEIPSLKDLLESSQQ